MVRTRKGKGWHGESNRHRLARNGIKTATNKKPFDKVPQKKSVYEQSVWTEQEMKLVLRRINAGKITPSEVFKKNKFLYEGTGVLLTPDHQKKGLDWLKKQHFTPTGKEKMSSPLGAREVGIIQDPNASVRVKDFYSPRGNYYYPLYEVHGDGTTMEYYVEGGQISIVG